MKWEILSNFFIVEAANKQLHKEIYKDLILFNVINW